MKRVHMKKITSFTMMVCISIAFFLPATSFAADFPHRINSEKRSEKEGLGRNDISLLKRVSGPGRETIAAKLVEHFKNSKTPITTRGASKKQVKGSRLSIIGDGWFLDVNGDGTNVRFRNYKYLESKPELAKLVSARLSNEKLEELGRMFIRENLWEHIKTGTNEELIPFYTEHAIGGGGQAKDGAPMSEEKVYASTVVFTRAIDKINVIGAGSKVAIMFDNEGTPVGFDYDWPQYRPTGKSQKVLPVEAVKSRVKKLASLDIDSPEVKVKRFDCGFYDAGAKKSDPKSVIQAACAIHSYGRKIIDQVAYNKDMNSGHIVAASIDFIPAGETVEKDEKWPQAMKILNKEPGRRNAVPSDGPKPR